MSGLVNGSLLTSHFVLKLMILVYILYFGVSKSVNTHSGYWWFVYSL